MTAACVWLTHDNYSDVGTETAQWSPLHAVHPNADGEAVTLCV